MVCGRQRADAVFQVLLLLASFATFVISKWQDYPIESFLWGISLMKSLVYFVYIFLLYRYSRQRKPGTAEGEPL
jgi:hypothetical protein